MIDPPARRSDSEAKPFSAPPAKQKGLEGKRVIVCGVGNLLLQDEGVGVHLVRALKQRSLPPGVEILEAGTSLLDFLPDLWQADHLILIDAMRGDGSPGSLYILEAGQILQRPPASPLSLHQWGVPEVLRLMTLQGMPPCTIIGIEPGCLDWGTEPSPQIRERLPSLVEAVREQILRLLSLPP